MYENLSNLIDKSYCYSFSSAESLIEDVPFDNNRRGVPIACASGDVSMTVRMKQSEIASGPKLDIDVAVGAIHILLYPQQLHTLLELLTGITNEGNQAWGQIHEYLYFLMRG